MTRNRTIYSTILMSALVTGAALTDRAAALPPAYHVTDLGTLGGEGSVGAGINANGRVAGSSSTADNAATHAFLYDGTMHDLGSLVETLGTYSFGNGINASGQVAGSSYSTGGANQHAFLYDGTMHDLGTLGGTNSFGNGINDNGQVTGGAHTTGDAAFHAFLYDGTMHDLGTLGGPFSYGYAINAEGQVTGNSILTEGAASHAFLWTPATPNGASGGMQDLGTLGGSISLGSGINDSGQVTGGAGTIGNAAFHAFLYDGTMHDLGTLGGTRSQGLGINASGQVTGYSEITNNVVRHAFLYTSDSGMVDLNSLIDPLSGWDLISGLAINDAGQITGYGFNGSYNAFLLTPVPEPASLVLIALGAAALAIRRSRRITSVLCLCCALSATTAAHAAQYTVTDLGTLGGTTSYGIGINASGQVSGYAYTTENFHGFLWTPTTPNGVSGTMQDLGTLGGSFSNGFGINDSGQVSGYSQTTGDTTLHAFLYDGTMSDLGTLGGTYSVGYGINDSGQVAGQSQTTGDAEHHAIQWAPTTPNGASGTMHDLGTLGGTFDAGFGINDSGQVTGYASVTGDAETHAFLWTPTTPNSTSGTMHDLGTLGGAHSIGIGINASGQVTGKSSPIGNATYRAFLYDGTMHDLGTLGGTFSEGHGINDSGQVTGGSYTTGTTNYHAFLYTSGSGMVDLNLLIDPLSGWELLFGAGINDAGQITGQGLIGGEQHAFLLTPVPEPASLALLAFGLPFLIWRPARRSGTPMAV